MAAPHRRAAVEHHPAPGRRRGGRRRDRGRGRVAGRAHRPARRRLVARRALRSARRAVVRQRLRLGLDDVRRAELRRCGDGGDAVLLPPGLPADGGGAPAPRPRRRGGGGLTRPRPVAGVLAGDAARRRPGGAGRCAARRSPSARGVRRPAAAQLPDADHLDPPAVRDGLQRSGGDPAGRRARRLLPRAAAPRAAPARQPPPRPDRCRREPPSRAACGWAGGGGRCWPGWPGSPSSPSASRSPAWCAGWSAAPRPASTSTRWSARRPPPWASRSRPAS